MVLNQGWILLFFGSPGWMAVLSDEPTFVGMFVAGHASFMLPTSVHDSSSWCSCVSFGVIVQFCMGYTVTCESKQTVRSSFPWPKLHLENWELHLFLLKEKQLLQSGIPNGWCPFLPCLQVHLNPFLDHSLRAPGWSTLQSGTSGRAVEFGFAEKWVDKMSGNFWGAS